MSLGRRAWIVGGLGCLAAARLREALRPPRPTTSYERILVLGYAAIGDLIYFLPALRALREACPRARLVFVANRYPTTEELMPVLGLADEIWTIEASEDARARREAERRIREERFDLAVLSPATPARFFARALLSIPLRAGHCRPLEAPRAGWSAARYALWRLRRGLIGEEFERRLVLNRKVWVREDDEHMVRRGLRLIEALGLPVARNADRPPELPEPIEAARFAEKLLGKAGGKVIGLHLGSRRSQYGKIWEPERLGEVCRELARLYPVRFAVVGAADEAEYLERFKAAFQGPLADAVGKCGLLGSLAMIRRCALFLSSDTGLAKAAMALGVRTATIWGPSDRPGWGIYWEPDKHLEIYRRLPCAPCVRMGLPQEGAGVINFSNCGHRACLRDLAPADVLSALRSKYDGYLNS